MCKNGTFPIKERPNRDTTVFVIYAKEITRREAAEAWSRWKDSSLSRRGTMSLMMGSGSCGIETRLEETLSLHRQTVYSSMRCCDNGSGRLGFVNVPCTFIEVNDRRMSGI